jgi:hypothetical protein
MRRRSPEIDFGFLLVLLLAAGPFTHRNAGAPEDSSGPNEPTLGQKGEIFIEASGEDGPLRMTVNHASIIKHWDQRRAMSMASRSTTVTACSATGKMGS